MINLLPFKEKQELMQEESWKLFLIHGVHLVIFFISLTLVLFAINIYLSDQVQAGKNILPEIEKNLGSPEKQEFQNRFISLNNSLENINNLYKKTTSISSLLEKISKTLLPGMYLKNTSLAFPAEGNVICSVEGFSPSRDNLLQFKKNLEIQQDFTNIKFPISSWDKPLNIDFDLTFEIKNTAK